MLEEEKLKNQKEEEPLRQKIRKIKKAQRLEKLKPRKKELRKK